MKTKLNFSIIVLLLVSSLGFSQNQSNGAVVSPITGGAPFEAFRFRPGLITQLDFPGVGASFNFGTDTQWLSAGKLTTATQTLYGIRVQRAGKGLVMGYTGAVQASGAAPTAGGNPFIQWVGNDLNVPATSPGNLEFRTSTSSSNPTSDKLVMTLRQDATALFGFVPSNYGCVICPVDPLIAKGITPQAAPLPSNANPKVEINSTNRTGLQVINVASGTFNNIIGADVGGLFVHENQIASGSSFGVSSSARATATGTSYGVRSSAVGGISNYGLYSSVTCSNTVGSINYGIYATVNGTCLTNPIAGYFNGNVFATNVAIPSDKSLKKDIKVETSTLETLMKLNPVTYNFIAKQDGLNLSDKLQHGFIAQELEKIYPELVTDVVHPIFNDKNQQTGTKTLKAVNYIGLISVLTESIKELSNEVTVLKEKITKSDKTYVVNNNKNFTDEELKSIKNNGFYLGQNTPNPFKTSSVIEYSLPENERNASLLILNLNGQTIKEYKLSQVKGSITVDAGTLQKGMYLYSLVSNGEEVITKKMLVN